MEAKRRDLSRFLSFYQQLYGHDRPDEWYRSVTREFLKQLRRGRPAQATVVRTYASVRHFGVSVFFLQDHTVTAVTPSKFNDLQR
jgi:hypothetical protein